MAKSPEMTHDNFTMHLPKPVNLVNFVMASPKSGSPQRQAITIKINQIIYTTIYLFGSTEFLNKVSKISVTNF